MQLVFIPLPGGKAENENKTAKSMRVPSFTKTSRLSKLVFISTLFYGT
jgi:hypothetical protein